MNLSGTSEYVQNIFHTTSITELLVFILSILYILLAAKENTWCWPFGIAASALSVYLCYSGQLYLESGLQIFYVLIGFYGWHQWHFGSDTRGQLPIVKSNYKETFFFISIGITGFLLFGYLSSRFSGQALPYLDGFVTSFSIVATYMTSKKHLNNWIFWIIINSAAIYLYAARGFELIAFIYILYTFISVLGFISWKKKLGKV